jgi:hypothetical protein
MVDFWEAPPGVRGGVYSCGIAPLAQADFTVVDGPPDQGECLPLESVAPIHPTIRQKPKAWLVFVSASGRFHLFAGIDPPIWIEGELSVPTNCRWVEKYLDPVTASLIYPHHRFAANEIVEVPNGF